MAGGRPEIDNRALAPASGASETPAAPGAADPDRAGGAATGGTSSGGTESLPEQTIFAALPGRRANWLVGSVHGEARRLVAIHAALTERIAPEDNLVYLGNFLGRGPDVAGTVQELLLFRRAVMARQTFEGAGAIAYLRGRQEEMWHKLLQIQFAPNPREVLEWMLNQGLAPTLEAYGGGVDEGRRAAAMGAVALSQWTNRLRAALRSRDGHDKLISAIRRAAFTLDGALLMVSAGVDPSRPLSEQNDSFWWGGRGFEEIEPGWAGFARIIRGFDPRHQGIVLTDWLASLDGGCGFGGTLVAAGFAADGALIDSFEV